MVSQPNPQSLAYKFSDIHAFMEFVGGITGNWISPEIDKQIHVSNLR